MNEYGFYEQETANDNILYQKSFIYQPISEFIEQEECEISYCNVYNDNNSNDKLEEKTKARTNKEDSPNEEYAKKKDLYMNNLINNNNKISINIINVEEKSKQKKKCGRKRMRSEDNKVEHNKFADDNVRRKCKHLVLKCSLEFINNQIKKKYNGNVGNGVFKKELQTLNQSQKSDATIIFNQIFLTKTLGEIFSANISGRFTNFPPNYNKLVIDKLMNENDEDKRIYFNNLFNITFLECLRHFRGEKYINELEGLKCFNDIKKDIANKYEEDGEEYIETLEYYLNNYEEIINNKKAIRPRKANKIDKE